MICIIKFLLLFTKNINFVFKKLPKQMFVFGLIVRKHQQVSDYVEIVFGYGLTDDTDPRVLVESLPSQRSLVVCWPRLRGPHI